MWGSPPPTAFCPAAVQRTAAEVAHHHPGRTTIRSACKRRAGFRDSNPAGGIPARILGFTLGGLPLAIFVRQDHPLIAQTLTSQMIRQYPQVALYVADREELIGGQSLARNLFESDRGILETSHLLTAFEILRETDYLLICPAYLARNEGATRDIVALTLPLDMTFSVQYSLIAHRRTEHSPIHQWLWQEIVDTVQSMRFRTVHRG